MLYFALLFTVCGIAFIYCLLIEMPFIAVEKFLMGFIAKSNDKRKPNQDEKTIEMPVLVKATDLAKAFSYRI